MGEFRLGIQKCKKTIQDTVKDKSVFQFRGVENLFYILRKNIDQKDQSSFSASFVSAFYLSNTYGTYSDRGLKMDFTPNIGFKMK